MAVVAVVADHGRKVAEDELDGLVQAAGGFALPDLAEAAAAYALNELVAGNRFGKGFDPNRHEVSRGASLATDCK